MKNRVGAARLNVEEKVDRKEQIRYTNPSIWSLKLEPRSLEYRAIIISFLFHPSVSNLCIKRKKKIVDLLETRLVEFRLVPFIFPLNRTETRRCIFSTYWPVINLFVLYSLNEKLRGKQTMVLIQRTRVNNGMQINAANTAPRVFIRRNWSRGQDRIMFGYKPSPYLANEKL